MSERQTCFVIQGYGQKTDFTNGRKLNLDASYQVIKEAVEEAGLKCIRCDEVLKSGSIDIAMYKWILKADLVIADLSTYNVNAAYELGVRYGVAPKATIILAEDQFTNPFDLKQIVLHRYKHLGEDIGNAEAKRFKAYLVDTIRTVMSAQTPDSPFYELLDLVPPSQRQASTTPAVGVQEAVAAAPDAAEASSSAKDLLDRARDAMAAGRFVLAKELLQTIHDTLLKNDPYVMQQLALATYKSKDPDPVTALEQANHILVVKLKAETTNDPETLGLWGAVHKRLWDLKHDWPDLDGSVAAYERGFFLKQDYYNGINLAFLYNVRASEHQKAGRITDAVADFVLARRVRRDVMPICERALDAGPRSVSDKYWILATLWEAAVGLEDTAAVTKWRPLAEEAAAAAKSPWMIEESTKPQLARLASLLETSPLRNVSFT